ncbi:fatty acid desaturase 2-like [Plakobranchus ocellatus]|uniref:Fatty acid desaturase 2-like n=1 Tax=Plakobranchus ocellatus TaxID=259542 RepID=A0AAV4BH48_9GAST|nr:fatty acid desaturase 2-like [Plakobranchus ocellatus]
MGIMKCSSSLTLYLYHRSLQAQVGWLQHDFGHLAVFKNISNLDHIFHFFTMGIIKGQVGWLQHDFGHLSVFRSSKLNHALHYFSIGLIKGLYFTPIPSSCSSATVRPNSLLPTQYLKITIASSILKEHFKNFFLISTCVRYHDQTLPSPVPTPTEVDYAMGWGASPSWWNHMHYQHHAKPNVMDKDPDVRLEALFVVGEHMPVKIAKEKKKSMPYNWQNYYFFLIGPPLLFPVYFQIMLFKYIFSRRAWMDLLMVTIFFIKFFYLFTPLLGLGGAIAYYFTFRCLESHWFTWVAQSNHIPMEIDQDQGLPWLKLQLQATCNVEKSVFNDWFTGHLNFQIEHHLFPTMPRHNLYKIAPLVKSLCEKHGVPYQVKPLSTAFADIVRSLKHSGDLWASTYHAYHAEVSSS